MEEKNDRTELFEDMDIDKVRFRPLTKGLGFHPKEEFKLNHVKPTHRPVPVKIQDAIKKPLILRKKKVEKKAVVAKMKTRFQAFCVDLLILLCVTGLTFFFLILGANLKTQVLVKILGLSDILPFAIGLFTLYFLLYFSILDLTATVGKSLLGIKVRLKNRGRPKLEETFFGALFSLFSLMFLGLPTCLGLYKKMLELEVYEK
jgi:hypothetical protein